MSRRESACQAKRKMAEWERVVDEGLDERVRVSSGTSQTKIFLLGASRGEQARVSKQLETLVYRPVCKRSCRYADAD